MRLWGIFDKSWWILVDSRITFNIRKEIKQIKDKLNQGIANFWPID